MAGKVVYQPFIYPWPEMEVGDECLISRADISVEYTESLIRHSFQQYTRKHCPEKKFSLLIISETEVQVWRVR
jgi:hypothetical protein